MKEKNILQVLRESRYTVVLSGVELMKESGYPLLRDGDESYEIEEKYGYSFEEIFSSSFYSARKERFFRFYKEVILKAAEIPPGQGFYDLKQLQDYGLIHSIITRRIAGLEDRAGCRNVINLKGTIFHLSELRQGVSDGIYPGCERSSPLRAVSRGDPAGCMSVWRDDRQRTYDTRCERDREG